LKNFAKNRKTSEKTGNIGKKNGDNRRSLRNLENTLGIPRLQGGSGQKRAKYSSDEQRHFGRTKSPKR
jgi:hypothetical protein